jgi:hypothetical protein
MGGFTRLPVSPEANQSETQMEIKNNDRHAPVVWGQLSLDLSMNLLTKS